MANPELQYVYPEPLAQAYLAFEAYCVGACCGIQAYDMNAHRLIEMGPYWSAELFVVALDQLDDIANTVGCHRGAVTDGVMWWANQDECLEFLDLIRTELLRALVSFAGTDLFDARWLAPNVGAVEHLARGIVRTRAFSEAPILADALEEAGCTNADLLARCRTARPDADANWAVSLFVRGAEGAFARPIAPTPDPSADGATPT
jgi:hypothetical protein